jgi:type III restriction enzyme
MNERVVRDISNRLSLRPPQREALSTLGVLASALRLPTADAHPDAFAAVKRADRVELLQACTAQLVAHRGGGATSGFRSFDREFPSFTFALATGVGKTRLMGAQMAYLHRVHGVRHFFVVAPNLTIYDKLRRDFTPNTSKYVFEGLPDFAAQPPELITGDDWEVGRGSRGVYGLWAQGLVHINLFNISKFDSKDGARMRSRHDLFEEGYFKFLASLPDLVVLMDESHRYRARAAAAALNELSPLLGIELTATPQVQHGNKAESFTNVVYRYSLAEAIHDGFVKRPAVAGRLNMDHYGGDQQQIDRAKLEDALVLHEKVRAELDAYAIEHRTRPVKPFVLVIARDTVHATQLEELLSAPDFHRGMYAGKVITVHSNRSGAEKDDVIERLLKVEDPDDATEIVVHVEMLKEGWDVTNLYTIVPLRAANSRTLVEQSIGRGLRLPYGKTTGVAAVDRLTIVAHDKFKEIVAEAERADSPFRLDVIDLDGAQALEPTVAVEMRPAVERLFALPQTTAQVAHADGPEGPSASAESVFATPLDRKAAQIVYGELSKFSHLPTSDSLFAEDVQAALFAQVRERMYDRQGELAIVATPIDLAAIIKATTSAVCRSVIDIPRIVLEPDGETLLEYDDTPMPTSGLSLLLPEYDIVVQELQSRVQERVRVGLPATESQLENYIMRELFDEPDLDYGQHAPLFARRVQEVLTVLSAQEPDEQRVHDLVAFYARLISGKIAAHLRANRRERPARYHAVVRAGWTPLASRARTASVREPLRDFRLPVDQRFRIRQMRFVGFARCLFDEAQFDSDGERRLAVLLEDDIDAKLRWFRPSLQDIRIFWSKDRQYLPDFVVETSHERLLIEIKASDLLDDGEVRAKAQAATQWCGYATAHAKRYGGLPWRYVLVPEDAVGAVATLSGLVMRFGVEGEG